MEKKRTIFLTGSTGFLGSYLLKVLLEQNHRVYALTRKKHGKSIYDRIKVALDFWDKRTLLEHSNNLIIVEGDITDNDLFIDRKIKNLLKKEIEEILHCAAVTEFNLPLLDIRRVNVCGTKNVLEFALSCKNLKKISHISTAFICGGCKAIFKEVDLDVGQKVNTSYEQSKLEAEKVVKLYRKSGLWIDIFRPAFIAGESTTGKIPKFQNLYQLLRLCNSEIFTSLPMSPDKPINFASVDHVVKALLLIFTNSKRKNCNYHLFPAKPLSVGEFLQFSGKYIGFEKPRFVSWENLSTNNFTPAQKAIIEKNKFYFTSNTQLNSEYTVKLLKSYNFNFPRYNAKILSKLIQYAIDAKFIIRKH
jgi:thioester reductase-like protein